MLGISILLLFSYETGVLSFIIWVSRQFRHKPKVKQPAQTVLTDWVDDKYPYNKRWVSPDEDSEFSEASGYESSAVMDEEDEGDI